MIFREKTARRLGRIFAVGILLVFCGVFFDVMAELWRRLLVFLAWGF